MNVFKLTGTLDKYVDFYNDNPREAEILVVGGSKIELEKYPNLKYIFKCGVGVDNIPDLEGTGIELIMPSEKTKFSIYDEVSSFTVHSILSAQYNDIGSINNWNKKIRSDFRNKNIVVIGIGKIGSLVYKKLQPFTNNVTSYDPLCIPVYDSLEDAIRKNDIITLHCPLTDDNIGMIKTEWLKDDVILINTARAHLVDEVELYDFLKDHPNAKAVFDVFWREPYKGILLELDNFISTPHIASSSEGFSQGLYNDLINLMNIGL